MSSFVPIYLNARNAGRHVTAMEKTSLKYLQLQTSLEQVIETLQQDLWGSESVAKIREALTDQAGLLPSWLYVEAVEQAPVAISITDNRANILYVNKAFTEVTGYLPQEVIGKNESILSDKMTPRHVYRELWHRIMHKQVWHGILVNRHKQGERYLADLTIAPMLDGDGRVSHFIGMHRDVTESYGYEQRLNNQKTLIESVVNATPVATVVLDEQQRVILDNQMYKAMISDLGVDEPALMFIGILRGEMKDEWDAAQASGRGFRNREVRIDLGGHLAAKWYSCAGNWFEENDVTAGAFFRGRKQQYLLLSLTDITQQKKHHEEAHINTLRILMAEEEQIRSLRETLLGAIHRIRQPINQIEAAKGLLERRSENGQTGALLALLGEVLDSGEDTVNTLSKSIPQVLSAPIIPVNLNQTLHEVLLLSRDLLLASGVTIDWKPTPVLPSILGSENRLRTLFKQIIDNAVEAMNHAGSVERELRIETRVEGDNIRVVVQDTGPGIPADVRQKVFEPFFTTRGNAGRQAGMGLVMVLEIVNQHGGIIEIDPAYDGGCRVVMQFQIVKKPNRSGSFPDA